MHIVRRSLSHPDAVALCAEVQAIYATLYGGGDASPMTDAQFEPPAGGFLVGYLDDEPVASGSWRRLSPERAGSTIPTGEVKRVFVRTPWQRRGFASQLMRAVEDDAQLHGIGRLVLETGPAQPQAIAMYRALGYTDTDGAGWAEYVDYEGTVTLEVLLPRRR